jgi:arsenate reductase-like glutaredoxin family protein
MQVTEIKIRSKPMKLEEIKEIAQKHGIKAGRMKKAELVRAIQSAEENETCFETGHADNCGQDGCKWRGDCN